MALYEHIYLARQDISAQQADALTARFKAVIESFGGKVEKMEYWGVKSLAYRIKKNRKAHFSLLNIDAPPAALTEMERQMGINEDVIRFMTVRVEALEQGPSAMMRKRDDDDRGDRHDRGDRGRGPRPERSERAPRRPRDDDRGKRGGELLMTTSSGPRRPFFRRRKTCPFCGPNAPKSITRTRVFFRATFPSAARSSRRELPPFRPRSSASWRKP